MLPASVADARVASPSVRHPCAPPSGTRRGLSEGAATTPPSQPPCATTPPCQAPSASSARTPVSVTSLGADRLESYVKESAAEIEVPNWRKRFVMNALGARRKSSEF